MARPKRQIAGSVPHPTPIQVTRPIIGISHMFGKLNANDEYIVGGRNLRLLRQINDIIYGRPVVFHQGEETELVMFLQAYARQFNSPIAKILLKRIEIEADPPEEMIDLLVNSTIKKRTQPIVEAAIALKDTLTAIQGKTKEEAVKALRKLAKNKK